MVARVAVPFVIRMVASGVAPSKNVIDPVTEAGAMAAVRVIGALKAAVDADVVREVVVVETAIWVDTDAEVAGVSSTSPL